MLHPEARQAELAPWANPMGGSEVHGSESRAGEACCMQVVRAREAHRSKSRGRQRDHSLALPATAIALKAAAATRDFFGVPGIIKVWDYSCFQRADSTELGSDYGASSNLAPMMGAPFVHP